jgi:hypothetical protein
LLTRAGEHTDRPPGEVADTVLRTGAPPDAPPAEPQDGGECREDRSVNE